MGDKGFVRFFTGRGSGVSWERHVKSSKKMRGTSTALFFPPQSHDVSLDQFLDRWGTNF